MARVCTLSAACALALLVSVAHGALPQPKGYVNDFGGVMDAAVEAQVDALVRGVAKTSSAEIVVVTVPSLEGKTVERYAVDLFAAWGIGKKAANNGVLVLVSPSDRAMRIEVGYGLEPILPDGLTGEIVRTAFLPRFREGEYGRGILDGVSRVAAVVRRGERQVPQDSTARGATSDVPPAWLLIPFLGLFVAGGAFGAGVGARAKTSILLLVGGLFGGIPLLICLVEFPGVALLTLGPIAMVMGALGYSKANSREWLVALRGKSGADTDDWVAATSSSSSDGGSSSDSSSDSFGGGSSGGGGASGHW